MIQVVQLADERNGMTENSRFAYILMKIMDASLKGNDSVRVDGFLSWDTESGDIMAKKIAKMLTKNGFKVSIKIVDKRIYMNETRSYYFEISWKEND